MNKKLYRDEYHKVLGGVCSGLAEYFDMDPTIVRLLFAFTFFIMGVGLGTYIILWIVLPRKGYPYNNFNEPKVDYTMPPQQPGSPFNTPLPPPPSGDPFGGNPFANNTYGGKPFVSPVGPLPPKQKSHAGIIVGLVLIFLGAAILIDEFDIIPDFDFWKVWPAILVIVGGALIISGQKRHPWEKQDWQTADKIDDPSTDAPASTGNTSTDKPSTDNLSTLES